MNVASNHPGEILQIVNQSGLQLYVAFYDLNIFGELWRKFLRIILQVGGCCQGRGQRRTQFMAERCKKVVLGLTGFLRCNFFCFILAAPNLIGDVSRDLGETANVSLVITKRSDYYFRFKGRSVFANAETLVTNVASARRFAQIALRLPGSNVVRCIEGGEVFADDFLR